MSRPTAISPEEQEQIARRIGVLLLQNAGEDWQQITVEYRATGEYHDLLGEVAFQDGSTAPWEPPEELLGIFEHLREGMYRPDVGTWLSALYVVERPSSYRIDINFDSEPQWRRPLPRAAYVDELRRYPRNDENVPDWLKDKLDGNPAANAVAAEPGAQDVTPAPAPAADVPAESASPAAASTPSATGPIADDTAPPGAVDFRIAKVFDDVDEQGRPLVSTRAPVHPDEVGALRRYLENAPIVSASRDNEADQLDAEAGAIVPGTWHTDGTWLWQGAVPYYLTQYGVPPEPELLEHVRSERFVLAEVDDRTRDAAVTQLLDTRPPHGDEEGPATAEPGLDGRTEESAVDDERQDEHHEAHDSGIAHDDEDIDPPDSADEPDDEVDSEPESFETDSDPLTSEPDPAGSRHGRADERDEDSDTESVLADLHDRLTGYAVDSDHYRIGSHNSEVFCLLQEGPDWIVTSPAGDVRFARPDQAAAYLLGTLLMSQPVPTTSKRTEAPQVATPVREAEDPSREASQPEQPAAEEPTAEQSSGPADLPQRAPGESQSPGLTDLPRRAPERSNENTPGGHFLFTANQGPAPESPDEEPVGEDATRFQALPQRDMPAPPAAPQPGPANGHPVAPRPEDQDPQGGLPKRPPRPGAPDSGLRPGEGPSGQVPPGAAGPGAPMPPNQGPANPAQANPAPHGPAQSGPAGGAERRPTPPGHGPAGPPRQGPGPQGEPPRPAGGPPRPPQGGPGEPPRPPQSQQQANPQQQAPGAGREQQIQPLPGEPPLTLYRDRRQVVLQPGTDLDRFGDPSGNVTYAIRTPYRQRSLPPQWSSRPYLAYRVQRPVQVLRGTAVPWFEQPGGGTSYVLPGSVSELVADGTLIELSGNEAPPRPSMD
jgi:hypothetical protein